MKFLWLLGQDVVSIMGSESRESNMNW